LRVEQLFALNEFISRTVDPGCKSLVIGCFTDAKAGYEAQTFFWGPALEPHRQSNVYGGLSFLGKGIG
jgi:hypothetical protein